VEISINEPETWEYSLVEPTEKKESVLYWIQLALTKENETEFPSLFFDQENMLVALVLRFNWRLKPCN
jgi:hypothetical protein